MVTVVVIGETLRQMVDEPELKVEVSGPTTVQQLLEAHPDKLSGFVALLQKGELLITVNRKVGVSDSRVRDGDTVKLTHNYNPTFEGAMWHNP